jgi:hypothetical protein
MNKTLAITAIGLLLRAPSAAGLDGSPQVSRDVAPAAGMAISLPLVARLIGAGPTLYTSTVDVQNNGPAAGQVDWYLSGVNLRTSAPISLVGSISSTGGLVAQGTGGTMRGKSNAHFEDFVDSLVQSAFLPSSIRDDGFIGSTVFVFNGFTKRGQGSATVRFFNALAGGTVGQSLKGHEITAKEPQSVVGLARDTRGKPGAQLYANIFINNEGVTPGGVGSAGAVTVRVQAVANSTGQNTGTPLDAIIGPGQTVGISDVLAQLKVPTGEDTVLVYVNVIAGSSAIAGVFAQVDAVTRDGSTTDMSPVAF